jgi:hypothetical protein
MMGLIQRVMRRVRRAERPIDYEESKQLAASPDTTDRVELAHHSQARPEALYYLASDRDAGVRAAVAANEATPVQADLILARDRDDRVRVDLATKIARLTPDLSAEQHQRMREITYEVLEILVRDQVTRVRQVIADVLKDVANVPPDVIRSLARDSEIVVAGPVLRFSPVLTDEDLLQIIQNAPIPGALVAIASATATTSTRSPRSWRIPARRSARRRWTACWIARPTSASGIARWWCGRGCRRAPPRSSPDSSPRTCSRC